MATTLTRLTNSGTLYTSNYFDEVTGIPVVDSSLLIWLDAAQSKSYPGSGTTWTDLTGRGNNGSLIGGPIYTSSNGGSFLFNGTSQWVNLQQVLSAASLTNVTLSCWVNTSNITPSQDLISQELCYKYRIQSGTVGVLLGTGSVWTYNYNTAAILNNNTWYNIVLTVASNNVANVYVNGNLINSTSLSGFTLGNNADYANIGTYNNSSGEEITGNVSQAMIYSRALTANEIVINYNALAPRYSLPALTTATTGAVGIPSRLVTATTYFNQMDEVTGMINPNGLTALLNASSYAGYGNWNDSRSSPSNFDSTPLGVNIVNTVSNSGFYFPNTSTVAITAYNIPASFFTGTYTISAWVYFIQTNKGNGNYPDNVVLGNGRQVFDQGLHLGERSGVAYYGFYGDDLSGNTSLLSNTWYNLVYQYNANTSTLLKSIYVNGVFDKSSVPAGVYSSALNNTEIGRYPWGPNIGYTYGYISQIAFYNRILSPTEILTNYQNQASTYGKSIGVNSPVMRETTSSVNVYGVFDEVTPMIVSNGITLNLDALQYPGSGNWADLSPTSDSIVLNTTTFVTSTTNYFTFNGVNSYAYTQYLNPYPGPQTLSVGVWFRTTGATGRLIGYNITQGVGTASCDRELYIGTDGRVYYSTYTGTSIAVSSPSVYNNGTWHYALATETASTSTNNLQLYVDGVLLATGSSYTTSFQSYAGYWEIGGGQTYAGGFPNSGSNAWFPGNMAMIQVYNRVLSPAEVAENFNQTRSRFGV